MVVSQGMSKKSHLTPSADVLQAVLANGKSRLGDGFTRWRLEQDWPKIVGETMASQTLPCALEHGVLYVWVKHSTWIQQLWFMRESMIEKVNQHLQRSLVQDIKFTTNQRAAQGKLEP